MNHSRRKINEEQIQWRRDKVKELRSKCYGVMDISRILKISHPTIVRDIVYLNQQATERIGNYIDKELPTEYQDTLEGLKTIIKKEWEIAETATENREKTAALSLVKECLAMKLELLASASVIDRAVKFIDNHRRCRHSNSSSSITINSNNNNSSNQDRVMFDTTK